jgi:hypothetical protein
MLLTRRFFLFAPAVVTAANLMPVRAFTLEPWVRGIRYQTWAFDTVNQSAWFWEGRHVLTDGSTKPLSYFIECLRQQGGTDSLPYWQILE